MSDEGVDEMMMEDEDGEQIESWMTLVGMG